MKKSLLIFALAALMMPAFVSCSKDNKDKDIKDATPTFEAPKFQNEAMKLTLVQTPPVTPEPGEQPAPTSDIKSIEFTEGGIYIVARYNRPTSTSTVTKADDDEDLIYITGTYTMNGKTYVMEGFGTVTVEGEGETVSVTITEIDNETGEETTYDVEGNAEVPEETNDVYRTWIVDELYIKVTGGDLDKAGVSKTFKGCNMREIADYLKKNKVSFDDSDLDKYNITNITISGMGTFLIQFSDADPFVGVSDVNSGKFEYDFSASKGGNKIINVKGTGFIDFYMNASNQERCALTLIGSIEGNSTKYDSKIEFRLKENK